VSLTSKPFAEAAVQQLESEHYRYHQRHTEHLADLKHAIGELGDDPPAKLAWLVRRQRGDRVAASQLATLLWPLVQTHETLMGALDRVARLAGVLPHLRSASAYEVIVGLKESGEVAGPVIDALVELNTRRNELVHDLAAVTGERLLQTIKLALEFGRYEESFRGLLSKAGMTGVSP
jgi:hypothetical protein